MSTNYFIISCPSSTRQRRPRMTRSLFCDNSAHHIIIIITAVQRILLLRARVYRIHIIIILSCRDRTRPGTTTRLGFEIFVHRCPCVYKYIPVGQTDKRLGLHVLRDDDDDVGVILSTIFHTGWSYSSAFFHMTTDLAYSNLDYWVCSMLLLEHHTPYFGLRMRSAGVSYGDRYKFLLGFWYIKPNFNE